MDKRTAVKNLTKAFSRLTGRQKERIRFHLQKKTPICCGQNAMFYTDGAGGG